MSYQAHFFQTFDGDQTWESSDMAGELKLLKDRKNDLYPQGRDNVKKFLKDCQGKGITLKIKAKKTKPYWTWTYEPAAPGKAYCLLNGLAAFVDTEKGDQTWGDKKGEDGTGEIKLMNDRSKDTYPQGRENCEKFLKLCVEKKFKFAVHAKKTKPHWTWLFEVDA